MGAHFNASRGSFCKRLTIFDSCLKYLLNLIMHCEKHRVNSCSKKLLYSTYWIKIDVVSVFRHSSLQNHDFCFSVEGQECFKSVNIAQE